MEEEREREEEEEEKEEEADKAAAAAAGGGVGVGEVCCFLGLGLFSSRSSSVSPTLASELIAEMDEIESSSS